MTARDVNPPSMQSSSLSTLKILSFMIGLLPFWAGANTSSSYTWEKCVELAKANNAELRASFASYQAEKERQLSAGSGYWPSLSATVDGNRSDQSADTTNFNARLNLSQNLFDGLRDSARVGEARAKTEVALARYQSTLAKVSFDLKSSFQSLVYASESVKLAEEIVRRRQNNLRLVELRFQSGRENRGSVLLSKAYFNEARLDSLRAQNQIQKAQAQLARAIGMDEHLELRVQGEVPLQDLAESQPNFRELALKTPEHRRFVNERNEAEYRVDMARSRFFPRLAVTGSIGRTGEEFFPEDERWSVGVNLTLPLFDGFSDYGATRGAAESLAAAEANRINVDRELLTKLRNVFSDLTEAIMKLKVDENFRDAASLRAEIARNRYNNGLLSFEDWDGIENDLIYRQKTYLESRRDRVVKEAAWEQAQGKGILQ